MAADPELGMMRVQQLDAEAKAPIRSAVHDGDDSPEARGFATPVPRTSEQELRYRFFSFDDPALRDFHPLAAPFRECRPFLPPVEALKAEEARLVRELKRVRAHLRVEERLAHRAEVEREKTGQ